jgi:MtN3 and saliva related transmembrane protein
MLPQLYKSLETKKVTDVSWWMLVLYFLNCLLWLAYGALIFAIPLMIANGVALFISISQLVLKMKYK